MQFVNVSLFFNFHFHFSATSLACNFLCSSSGAAFFLLLTLPRCRRHYDERTRKFICLSALRAFTKDILKPRMCVAIALRMS